MKQTVITSQTIINIFLILGYSVLEAYTEVTNDKLTTPSDALNTSTSNTSAFWNTSSLPCMNNSTWNVSSKAPSVSTKPYLIILYIVVCGLLLCLSASFIECFRTLKRERMGMSTEEQHEVDRIREQRIMVVAKKKRREILESILHCQTMEEVKKNTANLVVSERSEKTEFTTIESSSFGAASFDICEAPSCDSEADQELERGTLSHKRNFTVTSAPSTDHRGAYSSLETRDDAKPDVAHQIAEDEYIKRSIACTDDSSECAICLCAYDDDDIVMFSKYCTHCFHKECIFEWLQNHDVCPCCRCPLVTTSEVNHVASDILGKTPIISVMKLYTT